MSTWRRTKHELRYGFEYAFRSLIPEPPNRAPLTWPLLPVVIAHYLPFFFLAYLVRRPDTHLIRLLLLPSVLMALLHASYGYMFTPPNMNTYNWALSLAGLYMVSKAFEWALVPGGRLKVHEETPGEVAAAPAAPSTSGEQEGNQTILPQWFVDALEVCCAVRGFGWDFGRTMYVPKETRPVAPVGAFLSATARSFVHSYLMLDLQESLLKLVPGVGSPSGGTMFLPSLPLVPRMLLALGVHTLTGSAFISGFQMVYDLATLGGVTLLGQSPLAWPPAMEDPWGADSLSVFWAKRWHQFLRQTFVVLGGYPGGIVGGRIGLVVGTFIASGMYHELAMYTMGNGFDRRVLAFFALQGVLVVMERVWKIVTGHRVRGPLGRIWVYAVIFILAQPCVDSWHSRGLAGGLVIPPAISPTRRILFPVIEAVFTKLAYSGSERRRYAKRA